MKIALIKLSALGDIIHASIIAQFLKKYVKDCELHWVVDSRFANILHSCKEIDHLITLPLKDKKYKKSLNILFNARKNNYDLAIDLQGLIKSAIISKIICKNVAGFDKKSVRESLASLFYSKSLNISYNENIIIRNLSLASFALNMPFSSKDILQKKPCFTPSLKAITLFEERFNLSKRFVLITVGSSVANKIYPAEKIIKVLDILSKQNADFSFVLCWGNDVELGFCKKIARGVISKDKIFILPAITLEELIIITNKASLVLGNDSGPTHLAFAQNIPSLTLFGATPSARNAYQTKINLTLDTGKIIDAKRLDKNDFCIKSIPPSKVAKLVSSLLGCSQS